MSKENLLDLLLHPVRIRIVNAFSFDRVRTTSELCARLPDVSQATVYRHVARLVDAGVLEVVDEQLVRGAVERHFRLDRSRAGISQDDAASMTLEDHRRAFTAAMAALVADFGAYLDGGSADPPADRVGYRQLPVWLDDDEAQKLIAGLGRLLKPVLAHRPGPGRRPYLLSPIVFPVAEIHAAT